MLISNAFAQTAGAPAGGSWMSFLPIIILFVAMYFLMIRPQMKRQKEHRNMMSSLVKGDEVVTTGGLLGKITKVDEQFMTLEVSQGVEVAVQKASVTSVLPKGTLRDV